MEQVRAIRRSRIVVVSQSNRIIVLTDACPTKENREQRCHTTLQKQQRLISVWAEFKQCVIVKAINQWRPWLRAYVRASGQHFEQLIN